VRISRPEGLFNCSDEARWIEMRSNIIFGESFHFGLSWGSAQGRFGKTVPVTNIRFRSRQAKEAYRTSQWRLSRLRPHSGEFAMNGVEASINLEQRRVPALPRGQIADGDES
jgi:hypothetical protein